MEKHVLLKKLRDALESLKGRVAGRNKDDVEDAIAMVSILRSIPFCQIVLFYAAFRITFWFIFLLYY